MWENLVLCRLCDSRMTYCWLDTFSGLLIIWTVFIHCYNNIHNMPRTMFTKSGYQKKQVSHTKNCLWRIYLGSHILNITLVDKVGANQLPDSGWWIRKCFYAWIAKYHGTNLLKIWWPCIFVQTGLSKIGCIT
jgi:hypothetical protein